jgi:hypothetical protein
MPGGAGLPAAGDPAAAAAFVSSTAARPGCSREHRRGSHAWFVRNRRGRARAWAVGPVMLRTASLRTAAARRRRGPHARHRREACRRRAELAGFVAE